MSRTDNGDREYMNEKKDLSVLIIDLNKLSKEEWVKIWDAVINITAQEVADKLKLSVIDVEDGLRQMLDSKSPKQEENS